MECGQGHSGSLSWCGQGSTEQDNPTSSAFVCSIGFWPVATLCTFRNENVHPTEGNRGQKRTTVGRQKWSGGQRKVFGMGSRTSRVKKYAPEETLIWKELQENRVAYFLRCLFGINVYSCLPASRRWRLSGIVICHWQVQGSANEAANDSQVGTAGSTVLCETEAFDHRRPRHQDRDSDALDRLHNGSPMAAFSV